MVELATKKTALHVGSIIGLVVVAHHFWPKGITYGEQEDWEKAYRKKHALRKGRAESRHRREERERREHDESYYDERRRLGEREGSGRYLEERPRSVYHEDRSERVDRAERPRSYYEERTSDRRESSRH